ncbi:hypothetical protein HW115_19025 [Verrucomicrobiaceae bacterium N1E253]|uniref:Uncharacterized protein n=1 Tax=Oceaniferula marina TaxID=2748318 RepID=A0A851GKQ3_9BACT|nr:hypothetical protein [Oceaniferula marina]NWK57719.1 hypothetical protein [Oceaniferula marina]
MAGELYVSQKMSLQTIIKDLATSEEIIDYSLHDALTDQADWNADYWDFHQNQLKSVKERIKNDYLNSSKGIVFAALWVSDLPLNDVETTIEDLLERFDHGRIGTRDRYSIKKSG